MGGDVRTTHVYVSTYCQHERHEDCRLTCKVCDGPCRCPCHDQVPDEWVYPTTDIAGKGIG